MALATEKFLKFSYKESRRSPRLSCFLPVSRETHQKYGIHHVSDISLNGLGVVCDTKPQFKEKDALIQLQVYIPGEAEPVKLVTQKIYLHKQYVGLKLVGSEKPSQKVLQEFYLKLCSAKTLEEGVASISEGAAKPEEKKEESVMLPIGSDKRVAQRRKVKQEFLIELKEKGKTAPIVGKVLDESRYGVSFIYETHPGVPIFFKKGHLFQDGLIKGGEKTIRTGPAKVCHVTPLPSNGNKRVIKIGLAIGNQPQRPECQVKRVDLNTIKTEPSNGILKSQQKGVALPISVHFKNARGEKLAGLLNTTFGEKTNKKVPVVIIPPGFGQRKEAASLLAQIMIHTFIKQNKELAVLRFDFTRSLGESYTDQEVGAEGSEYLTFTFTHGVEDIKGAVQFAEKNKHFSTSEIIILSSCFSSPMVRRVLTEGVSSKIGFWINFFGIASPQDWLSRLSGGKDLLSDYVSGKRNGVIPFSNSLINIDRLNEDLFQSNLASFEDAVREMPQIEVPVTWICGEADNSVPLEKIQKLMTLPAPAPRKMISLDSDQLHFQHVKAAPSFYLITQEIFSHLHHKKVSPSVPDPEDFKTLHQKECARLSS